MSPQEYIKTAKKKGLDGICLTEHCKFWPEDEYLKLCDEANGLVIINGNEQRCWDGDEVTGDFLVFGCRFNLEKTTIEELIKAVHDSGGIIIAAHPFRAIYGVKEELIYKLELDAIEGYSSSMELWQMKLAELVSKKMNKPLIGSSDAHTKDLVGYSVTKFTVPVKDEKTFVDAIKNRQFSAVPHQIEIKV